VTEIHKTVVGTLTVAPPRRAENGCCLISSVQKNSQNLGTLPVTPPRRAENGCYLISSDQTSLKLKAMKNLSISNRGLQVNSE
jgi:hypothetical protein